ncbi:MAG: imidazole glycerol phosphate synthase cyclase subunit [bacterium]|nr:imidazole glycerol phosphate synthase cyclase subunit [bacterium]
MLKVRVIPILIIQDGLLKKPVQFKNPRTVANPISIVRVFEERQVDELILLDRGLTVDHEDVDPYIVKEIAEELFVPFAFGGGIRSVDSMKKIIQAGAEKVVINTAAVEIPELITAGAKKFGRQCIVISIDALRKDNGSYEVYIRSGSEPTGLDPVQFAKKVERLGAGEILINSISHDGMMKGYDIELIRTVADAVSIPVIAAGGAGKLDDFVTAVKDGHASAVAAASIYHYTKHTPNMVKGVLRKVGIPVRQYPDEDYSIT